METIFKISEEKEEEKTQTREELRTKLRKICKEKRNPFHTPSSQARTMIKENHKASILVHEYKTGIETKLELSPKWKFLVK